MTLDKEIAESAKEIYTDGYDMSIGEIVSLYRDGELVINPEYQRLFRWDIFRKSRFVESILLGIPVPPIFVFQNNDGTWELVDGLQRLSTILEFMGILKGSDGKLVPPSVLQGTKLLPSLEGKVWDSEDENGIGKTQQLAVRRARFRVEILKKESDQQSKFELFQRLNTGGAILSDQEIRNSIMLMIRPEFYQFIKRISDTEEFTNSLSISDAATNEQRPMELVLRLVAYRYNPYLGGLDVNEYLDESMLKAMSDKEFPYKTYEKDMIDTFRILNRCLGGTVFKRFDGNRFMGSFSIAAFEAVAYGFLSNIDSWRTLSDDHKCESVRAKVAALWSDSVFTKNSGAGVRGTTRLANLLPHAVEFFRL